MTPRSPLSRILLPALGAALLGLAACDKGEDPPGPDNDYLIVDSNLVIDQYHFKRAHCDEVAASGKPRLDSLPPASMIKVTVISTVCYAVTVQVRDSLGKPVRTLDFAFDIPGRMDGDKERGAVGYLPWDRKNSAGEAVAPGAYKWLMDFRFGGGNTLAVVGDMRLE